MCHFFTPLYRWFLLLILLFASIGVFAQDASTGRFRLDQFLAELSTFSASFEQELMDEYGEFLESATGYVWVAKPGQFRWEYRDPYAQTIVSNGNTLWVYDEDLEQVSINPVAHDDPSSPAALLVGDIDIDEHYDVAASPTEGNIAWVKLTPKDPDTQYRGVEIGFNEQGLYGMKLRDNLGQLTSLVFADTIRNAPLELEQFNFVPPAGVDVLTNSTVAASAAE